MRDVSYPVRKAAYAALTGLTYNAVALPAYANYAPEDAPNNYITFGIQSNVDASTLHQHDNIVSLRVTAHTRSNKENGGKAADDIAGLIMNAIYPNRQAVLNLSADNLQCVMIELSSDVTNDFTIDAQRITIDRVLVFRLHVVHL